MMFLRNKWAQARAWWKYRRSLDKGERKVFCVGCNKTGTTSLAVFFRLNGYVVGDQEKAELLIEDWAVRDFRRITSYCESASFFQDIPFSLPDTFKYVDEEFPGSKFILTVRDSAEIWYDSLINHQTRSFSSNSGELPSEKDLKEAKYRGKYKSYILRVHELVFGYPKIPLYEKEHYMQFYEQHNNQVMKYFNNRPSDLLVLNLGDPKAHESLCDFLGLDKSATMRIPHLNKG